MSETDPDILTVPSNVGQNNNNKNKTKDIAYISHDSNSC